MGETKIYKSVVDGKVLQEFKTPRGANLFAHSANSNFIEDFISAAYVLCPDIIEVDGYIFIADFLWAPVESVDYAERARGFAAQKNFDKKKTEMLVNSWCFSTFFHRYSIAMENEKILYQFGDILVYFWTKRAKEIFPGRNLVVEYGENISGEEGLTITMYEDV